MFANLLRRFEFPAMVAGAQRSLFFVSDPKGGHLAAAACTSRERRSHDKHALMERHGSVCELAFMREV